MYSRPEKIEEALARIERFFSSKEIPYPKEKEREELFSWLENRCRDECRGRVQIYLYFIYQLELYIRQRELDPTVPLSPDALMHALRVIQYAKFLNDNKEARHKTHLLKETELVLDAVGLLANADRRIYPEFSKLMTEAD